MYILDKDKTIFGFSKRNRTLKDKPEEKKKKVKKSESFLQRVWNKKSKNKKNKAEISLSNNNLVEKLDITDDVTIKTLGELQNILKKQNSVVKVRFLIAKKTLLDSASNHRTQLIQIPDLYLLLAQQINNPSRHTYPNSICIFILSTLLTITWVPFDLMFFENQYPHNNVIYPKAKVLTNFSLRNILGAV